MFKFLIVILIVIVTVLHATNIIRQNSTTFIDNSRVLSDQKEPWGVVLVDLRSDGRICERIRKVLKRLADLSPHVKVEMWIHPKMDKTDVVHGPNVHFKHLKIPADAMERFEKGAFRLGYLSKVYALQHSHFQTAVFFDSEVWFCNGWEKAVDSALLTHANNDVMWTIEECSYCDYHFEFDRRNDIYVSPEVTPVLEEYKKFVERNTGTIVVIRKNNNTETFLKKAIEIFHLYARGGGSNGYARTDQAPMREAAFVMRDSIREALLPRSIWCRSQESDHNRNGSTCECNHCSVVHYLGFFDECTKNMVTKKQSTHF